MKHIFLFIILFTFLACNSKKERAVSKIKNPNPEKVIQKKLSGKEVVAGLEKIGYFNLTNESELDTVKATFEKSYTKLNFFQGPMHGVTLNFMDNRYQWVDCEELFEIGGLTEYLKQVKPTFEKLGLELEYANEKSEQDQNRWKHTIELNGIEYTAFEGQFSDLDWGIAYVNFIEMLNAELRRQNYEEQFYPINCGNDGMFVLLTQEQLNFVNRYYPMHNEHPTTIGDWKSRNGI
ncbi:hypothetical protein [Marinirhabdus gelatinilytica]|uniref:Uncharacterized protein n=1 Tax=Marinirhabdus gelatinilytica TaxID=1703343 RepID=A0A370Q624_9FLAO|nr:hypothetical protein [Marinirhabdus gelatinilytica]RDK83530.1 hypothetical protein C8D94_10767 [Marinirhabdus gelatinilytica]